MTVDTGHAVDADCEMLEFDSSFFDRRIARINSAALLPDGGAAVDRWCKAQGVECAYVLVDPAVHDAVVVAERWRCELVDIRVELVRGTLPLGDQTAHETLFVRPVAPADVDALRAIARASHQQTRFYVDGRFDRERCDALYDLWIAKSCQGWADRVFIAVPDDVPVGYVTCSCGTMDRGEIGLIGVDAASRGRGYARALLEKAMTWFAEERRQQISVVTQARNAAALRLYQRAGFTVDSIRLWYHKWF